MPYQLLADLVLTTHFGVVLFVIGGLVAIVVGNSCGWHFVNRWWFRVAHVAAIGVVVAQAWLGLVCPLTALESALAREGRWDGLRNSFIEYSAGTRVLYYEAPAWVFTAVYTAFGLAVVAAWWRFPPGHRG